MKRDRKSSVTSVVTIAIFACVSSAWTQTPPERPTPAAPSGDSSQFERHLDQLTTQLEGMREQLQESQREMDRLR